MANRFFGEVEVTAGAKTYKLRCDFNAMCHFEDATGKEALTAFADLEKGTASIKDMRAMMWAFMQHHQPDATLADAGDLLSENTGAIAAVLAASMPAGDKETGNARKPKAA